MKVASYELIYFLTLNSIMNSNMYTNMYKRQICRHLTTVMSPAHDKENAIYASYLADPHAATASLPCDLYPCAGTSLRS